MQERYTKFTLLIARICRSIRRIKADEMGEFNLKIPHLSCLYYLYRKDKLTAKELCEACDEDKGMLSRSLDYLESEGYVTYKNVISGKKYKNPLVLTDKGRVAGKRISEKVAAVVKAASDGLSDEERSAMYKGLKLISDNLQTISEGTY